MSQKIPQISSPVAEETIRLARSFVQAHHSTHDASHDVAHIDRVLHLATSIHSRESLHRRTEQPLDLTLVTLAALLHDVADHKYVSTETAEATVTPLAFLTNNTQLDSATASAVQDIVQHLSYSFEVSHPEEVAAALRCHPELGIVQDADRLDALGAVGIGRAFAYGGATRRGLDESVGHFGKKLECLEGMMKTETGRKMARVRTERLVCFRRWFEEELGSRIPGENRE